MGSTGQDKGTFHRSVSVESLEGEPAGAGRSRTTSIAVPAPSKATTYQVPVPEGAIEGDIITIQIPTGDSVKLTLPEGARAGEILEFVWPPEEPRTAPSLSHGGSSFESRGRSSTVARALNDKDGLFEIDLPDGVKPGDELCIMIPHLGDKLINITVPEGAEPGMKLAFYPPDPKEGDVPPSADNDEEAEVPASWRQWFTGRLKMTMRGKQQAQGADGADSIAASVAEVSLSGKSVDVRTSIIVSRKINDEI